jgi:hypothetical protein
MLSVVKRNISIDPLGVCDLKQLLNELLGLVLSIEAATQHCEVEGLYLIEVC